MMRLLCASILLALAGCKETEPPRYPGYVEGEYTYLSAPVAGYLTTLAVSRGTVVSRNQPVFQVSANADQDALNEAEAHALAAKARLDNLVLGRRAQEIAAQEAQVRAADSALMLAQVALEREEHLASRQFVAQARVDQARGTYQLAVAQAQAAREQLALFKSPIGRQGETRAANAELNASAAQVAQRRWLVDRQRVTSPEPGVITETYYRAGEWVPAGKTVASLLPEGARRLRFYVPQAHLARLKIQQVVEAHCDGCAPSLSAEIDFIAPHPEYTPPVLYGPGSREKLVFRVEAKPQPNSPLLPPGLPIEVTVPEH